MELTDETPFVAIPNFIRFDKTNIQYLDILIYTALKSFDNYSDSNCKPKHETVAKLAGMSKRFVINSIKRLEAAKFITVARSDKKKVSNQYYFPKLEYYEQIPVDIFEAKDLTANENAILICLRQFFVHGILTCVDSVSFFANCIGLSYNTVKPLYDGLVEKGYIKEEFKIYRNGKCNYTIKRLTDKISWHKMQCVTAFLPKPKATTMKLKVA